MTEGRYVLESCVVIAVDPFWSRLLGSRHVIPTKCVSLAVVARLRSGERPSCCLEQPLSQHDCRQVALLLAALVISSEKWD